MKYMDLECTLGNDFLNLFTSFLLLISQLYGIFFY